LPPINFMKEKKDVGKGIPEPIQELPPPPPEKPEKKKRKEKEAVALTADMTNGSNNDVTPSKKKVSYQ